MFALSVQTQQRPTTQHRLHLTPAGTGWEDLSGDGGCWKRTLRSGEGDMPEVGDLALMEWTAWLFEDGGRGRRVGVLQPNSQLNFTVGGGQFEATKAWDLAVSKMQRGERCEVVATSDYAFGRGAEPHVPADASMFFELELLDFSGLRIEGEPEETPEILRDELEADDSPLLKDLGVTESEPDPDNDVKYADLANAPPVPVEGSGKGFAWSENADELFLRLDSNFTIHKAAVDIQPTHLTVLVNDRVLVDRQLEGVVSADDSTWALAEDKMGVEIYLAKKRVGPASLADIWATVFKKNV